MNKTRSFIGHILYLAVAVALGLGLGAVPAKAQSLPSSQSCQTLGELQTLSHMASAVQLDTVSRAQLATAVGAISPDRLRALRSDPALVPYVPAIATFLASASSQAMGRDSTKSARFISDTPPRPLAGR